MLELDAVAVTYANGVQALRDVSLTVPPGVFGLLGPNGAGKSTLMRTLATLQAPDRGHIRFDGLDVLAAPERVRALLGYLPQDFGLYPALTAEETLDHFAVLKGLLDPQERAARVETLLQRVNLTHVATRRVDGFSGGMRQRLGIAIALVASPRLLIVDEPTAGLDPAERYRLLDLLAGVADDVVVLLSTHLVDDVEALCTRVALLVHGRIVREDTPAALVASLRGQLWQACVPRAQADAWRAHPRVISRRLAAGGVLVRAVHDAAPDSQFAPIDPTLEDVYFDELARQGVRSDQ